jgi:hypothetical protein
MKKFATEADINAIVTQAAEAALDDIDATDDFIQINPNDRQEFFQSGNGACGQTHRLAHQFCDDEHLPSSGASDRALPLRTIF